MYKQLFQNFVSFLAALFFAIAPIQSVFVKNVFFKNAKRDKVVGAPTGVSSGNPIVIDLGWGYYDRICTRHEKLADGTEFIGVGIQPDVVVEETFSQSLQPLSPLSSE